MVIAITKIICILLLSFVFIHKKQLDIKQVFLMKPTPSNSQQKILSTQNSRNSTFIVLNQQIKQPQSSCDSSLRLFTFMNLRKQDLNTKDTHFCIKSKNNKAKQIKKNINKCLKRESSGLIDIIEQSRKKREDFLKLILDEDPILNVDKNRKCKTPTNLKSSNNHFSTKNFIYKKPITPRSSVNKRQSFLINESKSQNKLTKSKSSLSQFQQNLNRKQQTKKSKHKFQKITKYLEKIDKQQQVALLKKKKDLQKQLVQINQTLLLGHNKKRNGFQKKKK